MTTPLDPKTVEQLAHVRLLHQQGNEQSRRPEPLSAPAILSFHDAVEMFYVVACDHLGIPASVDTKFNQYWTMIQAKVTSLVQRRGLEMLNRARNDYKHNFQIPGARRIHDARDVVNEFLVASTPVIFGVDYSSVSMVDVVMQPNIKALLRTADSANGAGDRVEAMISVVDAWEALFEPVPGRTDERPDPLRFGPRISRWMSEHDIAGYLYHQDASRQRPQGNSNIAKLLVEVTEVVTELQHAAQVTAVGIDYAEYLRFRSLTPRRLGYMDGHWEYRAHGAYAPTEEHVAFCVQFVVAAAVRLAATEAQLDEPPWVDTTKPATLQPWETIKTVGGR